MRPVSTSRVGSPEECSAQLVTEIVVPSLDDTLRFLLPLGFSLERRTAGFAALRWDESYLLIAEDARATVANRWMNIRVVVPDVHALHQKIVESGAGAVTPVKDGGYGLVDFVVEGPGGVEIRFAQVV